MTAKMIYNFFSSTKLALALLIAILALCVIGVTIFRGERAWVLIFSTSWFNSLLVLLVVNVAFNFFGRIWGRRLTVVSFGMILFHLSFVAILGGIVYNSLFYFRGIIRLTEGETLPSGQSTSYDYAEHGRYFDYTKLKGETVLIKMHTGYRVDGSDKRAAYEIAVGEGTRKRQGIIYITKSLAHNGFTYFNDREGYSVLVILCDKHGRELYGAHVPLQSLKQKGDTYLYTTGTRHGPGSLPFPQEPLKPFFALEVAYIPDPNKERSGEIVFHVRSLTEDRSGPGDNVLAEGKVPIGERIRAGDYYLSVQEVRYWVAMTVRYEPGKPIVLASFWTGLGGMVVTFLGRIRKRRGNAKES